jgi:hypothetical protein
MCNKYRLTVKALALLAVLPRPPAGAAQVPASTAIRPLTVARWPGTLPPRTISPAALPVRVNFEALAQLAPESRLTFPPAVAPLTARVTRITRRSPASWSLTGAIEGDPDGFLLLCADHDALVGLIQSAQTGQLYRIRYVSEGVHELAPLGPLDKPDCMTEGPGSTAATQSAHLLAIPTAPEGACFAPAPDGDVMIYYTPSARTEAGGPNAMNAECQLAVDVANQTYADSIVTNQLSLIFRGEIVYTEAGNLETDRNRLRGTSDGFMDFVHADRDYYGGDFVTLFVRDADADGCGIAFCTPSGPAEGFCVVDWTCASGNFSFAHEIGHLQGCAHNPEDAGSGCNEECYSFGHRFFGDSGAGWRTVMSYDNDNGDFNRIGRWANPTIFFDGQPCGVWTGDCDDDNRFNSLTVSLTAPSRELWRNSRFDVWVERFATAPYTGSFDEPYPTIQTGIDALFDGWDTPAIPVLHVKAQIYPETLTFSKRMQIAACGGSVVIGQ